LDDDVGYQYVRGEKPADVDQPECAQLCGQRTNNGCRPNPSYANNSQYSAAGHSNLSRPARVVHPAADQLGLLPRQLHTVDVDEQCRDSSQLAIDPFDLSKDWGRSDDDQRHRLVINAGEHIHGAGRHRVARISHGFQLSRSAAGVTRPCRSTSLPADHGPGTAGRPIVDGQFIERNAGIGSDFFSLGARLSRSFPVRRPVSKGAVEAFNVTNRRNDLTGNTTFGPGAYPTTRPRRSTRLRRSAIRGRFSSPCASSSERQGLAPGVGFEMN